MALPLTPQQPPGTPPWAPKVDLYHNSFPWAQKWGIIRITIKIWNFCRQVDLGRVRWTVSVDQEGCWKVTQFLEEAAEAKWKRKRKEFFSKAETVTTGMGTFKALPIAEGLRVGPLRQTAWVHAWLYNGITRTQTGYWHSLCLKHIY